MYFSLYPSIGSTEPCPMAAFCATFCIAVLVKITTGLQNKGEIRLHLYIILFVKIFRKGLPQME